ncbi:MAG TPA: tetratricopeptide repeat protein [Methanospirillum sp.]|nr:tetratricopeptide repeat protein [Methanospirillum sp.]
MRCHSFLATDILRMLCIILITALMVAPVLAGCGPSKGLFSGGPQLTSTLVSPTGTISETPQYAQNITSVKTEQSADDWIAIGNSQVQSGSYQEAITAYDKAIESDSKNAAAWNGKMSALLFQNKYTEVMELFSDAEKVVPNNPGIWINKGRAEYYTGNIAAIQSADTALRLEKDNIDALVLKANFLIDTGKNEEAQALTDRVLELDPQNAEIWYVQGIIQYHNKEYAKAIDSLEKDLKQNPDRICSYFYLTISKKETSGSEAVIEVIDRMTKQFPNDNRYANAEIGGLLIQLVKNTQGTYLRDTVPLWEWYFSFKDQGDPVYYQEYRIERWNSVESALEDYLWGSKGGFDDIETIMEPLLKLAEPRSYIESGKISEIYGLFAGQAEEDGRYLEAVKSAEKIINITPQEESERLYSAWYTKASSLNSLEKFDEALEAADTAILLRSNDSYAWEEKGNALVGLNRYEEALTAYEQEILMDPRPVMGWLQKGNTLYNLERYEEALTAYEQLIILAPDYGTGWFEKGNTQYKLEKYEEALESLNKAIDLGNDYASGRRDKILKELGMEIPADTPPANESSSEILNGTPTSEKALFAALDTAKEQKDWSAVINLTEDAILWQYPLEYRFRAYRADALIELGQIDEALDTYDRSTFTATTWGDQQDVGLSLANKGDALFRLGRYDEAIELYTQSAEKLNTASFYSGISAASSSGSADTYLTDNPDDFEGWGGILYAEGRYEEASEAFTQSIETGTYGYEFSPLFALAKTLEKMNKPTEAKEAYKKALNLAVAYQLLDWIDDRTNLGGGDPQVKDAAFTYALTLNPENAGVWSWKGDYLAEIGQYEEALKAYDTAIKYEKKPDYVESYQESKQTILEESQSGSRAVNQTS